MSFKAAVRAAPAPVNRAWKPGKRALSNACRSRVECEDTRRLTGGINLDSALTKDADRANEPRWDYGLGYQPPHGAERAIWLEVHPSATSNVDEVIAKLSWLRAWLRNEAPRLESLTVTDSDIPAFVWVATAGVHIPRNSPQARRLSSQGLRMPRESASTAMTVTPAESWS